MKIFFPYLTYFYILSHGILFHIIQLVISRTMKLNFRSMIMIVKSRMLMCISDLKQNVVFAFFAFMELQ